MHSNYIMYTIPTNGNQINAIPNTSNMHVKTQQPRINSTITNNSAVIRHNPITPTAISHQSALSLPNHHNNGQHTMPPNDLHMCQICCQTFQKASGLKKHMRIHQASDRDEDNSPFKCNACKIDYLNAVAFEDHIKTEHGTPQAFKCVDCGCFRSVELHTPLPFRCEGCSRRKAEPFDSSGTLNYRINTSKSAANSQQVHVSYAKTPKLDMDTLIESMRSGNDVTPNGRRRKLHQCPDCNKCYKHQSTLAMHKKIHSGEYKFKCQYCQKEFYLAEYYNRHLRVHTREKPFKCDVCDKSFSQSNTLIQHKRIHTGEKPYPCTVCGKSFSVRDYLLKHIRVHTGEKPFKCELCGKKYTQRSGLKCHQKSHYQDQSMLNGSQSQSQEQLQQMQSMHQLHSLI